MGKWFGAEAFAGFTTTVLIVTSCIGLVRSALFDPLAVHIGRRTDQAVIGGYARSAVELGLALSGLVIAFAVLSGTAVSSAFVIALGIPPILIWDMLRLESVSRGLPMLALRIDVGWAASLVLGLVALYALPKTSPFPPAAVWIAAGAVGPILAGCHTFMLARLSAARSARRRLGNAEGRLALDYILGIGIMHGVSFVGLALLTEARYAGLRATIVLLSPVGLLFAALRPYLLSRLAEREDFFSFAVRLSLAYSSLVAFAALALHFAMPHLEPVVGEVALLASPFTMPIGLALTINSATIGPVLLSRAQPGYPLTRVRLVSICAILVPWSIGLQSAWGRETTSLWVLPVGFALSSAAWWSPAVLHHLREKGERTL